MDKLQFFDLLWRLEEILMQSDHLRDQVAKCGGQCQGFDSIDDEGLCDFCCDALEKVMAEDDRLDGDKELAEVLAKLKGHSDSIIDLPKKKHIVNCI